jgi:hypothetical protein
MARKTEHEIHLDSQIRFWEGKQRKSRTTKDQLAIAKVLEKLRAERWPNPADEAVAVARAAKSQLKLAKAAATQAKEAEAAELEQLKEMERQKIRDETNPVIDHVKRAVIRATIRETTAVADQVPDMTPSVEAAITAPDGVVSSELVTKQEEAVENPPIQSDDQEVGDAVAPPKQSGYEVVSPGLLDMFKAVRSVEEEFLDYQDAKSREDELRRRHAEQHPTPQEPREQGQSIDSFTGLPKRRE